MILNNFTNIKHREKRIYSFMSTTISKTGILVNSLYLSFLMLIPFTIGGIAFCIYTDYSWYNPVYILDNPKSVLTFMIITIALPIFLGFFLNSYKVQNIRLVDYIVMVLTPKSPKSSDGSKINEIGYTIDVLVEKIN